MLEHILLASVPVLLVGSIVVAMLQQQTRRIIAEQQQALRQQSVATVVPLIVSALERATLYLDRIRPENLVARHQPAKVTAKVLYDRLLDDIRTEYEHNAVQQLYVSDKAWTAVVACRDQALKLVIEAAEKQSLENLPGLELAKRIQALTAEQTEQPITVAIQLLRRELQRLVQT